MKIMLLTTHSRLTLLPNEPSRISVCTLYF